MDKQDPEKLTQWFFQFNNYFFRVLCKQLA